MREYVVGFAFNTGRVLLQLKKKPEWQRNRFNGVGGKIEPNEHPLQAMRREFLEETTIFLGEWKSRVVLTGVRNDWRVHFFRTNMPDHFADHVIPDPQGEAVYWVRIDQLPVNTIPNLRWLIPFCLDDDVAPAHVIDIAPTQDPALAIPDRPCNHCGDMDHSIKPCPCRCHWYDDEPYRIRDTKK